MRIREVAPLLPRAGAPVAPSSWQRSSARKLPEALSVGLAPAVHKALDHPARRAILRGLHGSGEDPQTALELLPGQSPPERNYHTMILCHCQVIEQVEGTAGELGEPRFRSVVSGDDRIELVLAATADWDRASTLVSPQ
jgi:hypothetical protein